jgi:hypothetical protein
MEKLTGENLCLSYQIMEAWMSLRLSVVHCADGSTAKMMGGRNCQKSMSAHVWNIPPSINAFHASDDSFAPSFLNGGAMRTSPYERGFPEGDLLNAEARAVIDADFEEIHSTSPRKNFMAQTREVWTWIKQRLQKA